MSYQQTLTIGWDLLQMLGAGFIVAVLIQQYCPQVICWVRGGHRRVKIAGTRWSHPYAFCDRCKKDLPDG